MKGFSNKLVYSFLLASVLFFLVLAFLHPVYNSDDDFFFLYQLSGGHGQKPSNLLHYNFGMHPLLTWPVKELFARFPSVNWYSLMLLVFHFAAVVYFFYTLQLRCGRSKATAIFVVFFLFVEAPLLLSLNYSGASFIAAFSGMNALLVLSKFSRHVELPRKKILLFTSFFLILVSGLLRVHIFVFCAGLFLVLALVFLPFHQVKAMALRLLFLGGLIGLFAAGQYFYYQQKIPNWQQEEDTRQALFTLYNHPTKALPVKDSVQATKISFVKSLFLYDTAFVTLSDIKAISRQAVRQRDGSEKEDRQMLYWAFVNNRVYLLLLLGIFLCLLFGASPAAVKKWLLVSAVSLVVYFFLFVFYKITEAIFYGLVAMEIAAFVYCAEKQLAGKRIPLLTACLLLALSCVWKAGLLRRQGSGNHQKLIENRLALTTLKSHPAELFLAAGNSFPYGCYGVWDCPVEFPVTNFIYKELVLCRAYQPILQRFGITDLLQALPEKKTIYLTGDTMPLLPFYYTRQKGIAITFRNADRLQNIRAVQIEKTDK